ncbi:MAG: hypothetical protein ACOVNU_08215 [Candidatus Kapaibacteriota bacterium]
MENQEQRKDQILQEAQNYFGVKMYVNDNGITRKINHYAMDLWVKEMVNNKDESCPVCNCVQGTICSHSWHLNYYQNITFKQ